MYICLVLFLFGFRTNIFFHVVVLCFFFLLMAFFVCTFTLSHIYAAAAAAAAGVSPSLCGSNVVQKYFFKVENILVVFRPA